MANPLLLTLVGFRWEDLVEFERWMFSNYDGAYLIVFIIIAWCAILRTTADAHIDDLVAFVCVRRDKALLYRICLWYWWFVIYCLHPVGHLAILEWLSWPPWELTRDGIARSIADILYIWVLWRSRNRTFLTRWRTKTVRHLSHHTALSLLWRNIRVSLKRYSFHGKCSGFVLYFCQRGYWIAIGSKQVHLIFVTRSHRLF